MAAVLRGVFIYFFLLLLFRAAGKRSLAQIDTFDFVLLLIVSEATQNALTGNDYSITYSVLLITTLVGCEIVMAKVKQRAPRLESWMHGGPVIIVDHGKARRDLMDRSGVDEEEVLASARLNHGLERMEQVKYAVLENSGEISIVPMPEGKPAHAA